MREEHLYTKRSEGYELIDSGEHMKLERFGAYTLARPDTQAIWKKQKPEAWGKVDATFSWESGKGAWKKKEGFPEAWEVVLSGGTFLAKPGNFKHVGIFPEQEPNWEWTNERIKELGTPRIINLFGYTGAASVLAAKAGATVTHVDSSKASINWCRENAERSHVAADAISYVHEDVRRFLKRETKAGTRYDGIILDPPAFGRGAKDEVWKVEEDLLPLIEMLPELLSEKPGAFVLLNGYAAGYAPRSFAQLLQSVFPSAEIQFGELHLTETNSARSIPEGIYTHFSL